MAEEKWPRPADVTDDLTDGSVRRVWYVGGDKTCTHVEVWRPNEGLLMFFSAKGCVEVTKYWNGQTPADYAKHESQTKVVANSEPDQCLGFCEMCSPESIM